MSSIASYDVIVIGAGPAGYAAAIRCAQLGLKTASIDNWRNHKDSASLGGTFINAGCLSSMALLESAKIYNMLVKDSSSHGIGFDNLKLDVKKMVNRKNRTTETISRQIKTIFDHYGIDCIHAHGKLMSASQVEVKPLDQQPGYLIEGNHIILATGSKPMSLPCAMLDHELIIDTTQALNMTEKPKKLGIIGAGPIGLEMAGIWNKLGSKVIMLEAQETFLTAADQQIAQEAYLLFSTRQGLDIRLGARVVSSRIENNRIKLEYQDHEGNHHLTLDKLIVASGRLPSSENLAAAEVDLLLDENGFVHVDEDCCTNIPGVYAIGDLTMLGPMLAHKGLEEGVFVAEQIAGKQSAINYDYIPNVVYTDPEIAWVGQTEQTLKTMGENYRVGCFPFKASARAQSLGRPEGMVKIITQADTDIILGVHIIGVRASDLIAEAVLAMEFSASAEDLARTIHAHPTISETLHEAALSLANRALHMPFE